MNADEIYARRREFFNEHAESWADMWYKDQSTGRYDKHAKDFERLFSKIDLKPGDRVLDVGCGAGVLVPLILERITAAGCLFELDYSEKMIEVNKRNHPEGNIQFITADVVDAPLPPESCDAVICFSCFPHFHDKKRALEVLVKVLKKNGVFAMSHFSSSKGINEHHGNCRAVMHDMLPDEDAMLAMLKATGLKVKDFVDEPGFYLINTVKA
ncbi:MAG TPA: methyltransferase domain-containing protein [bacterium]|nr:methyltransferase domain-containing protein [bacterium]